MFARSNEVLFAVNSSGRVFYLNSRSSGDGSDGVSSKWLELPYLGIDFKRISATTPSGGGGSSEASGSGSGGRLWAIGGDHQVYVLVFGVEVPIRVREVTYENQRWNPIDGFSKNLLPTDRANFSSLDGTQRRFKDEFKLPTLAWQWDSEWSIDTNFNGKALDREGWTYAVDFPAEYSAKKTFTSCVRRRKWVRYRKYQAQDSWAAVPPLHKDITQEPFIDIAVGGHDIPNGDPNELQVWAVTVLGRVVVRQGVTGSCPEGVGWMNIPTPEKCEVSQVSVSPSGLVWAVTWNGKVLIRLGVTRIDPTGTHWSELDCPSPSSPLSHVCVGELSVWALSRDQRVWFRNGIRAASAGENESLAKGSKWIEMVGEMKMLSIGPGDQVFGVTEDDYAIVYRMGVTPSDLSGKTWQALTVQPVRMRNLSGSSSVSTASGRSVKAPTQSSTTVFVQQGSCNASFRRGMSDSAKRQAITRGSDIDQSMYESTFDSLDKLNMAKRLDEAKIEEDRVSECSSSTSTSMANVLDHEDHYDEDPGVAVEAGPQWVWVTGGSCRINPLLGPPSSWFSENSGSRQSLAGEPWRIKILQELRDHNETIKENEAFKSYASPIERTSWVRKGAAFFHSGEPRTKFESCNVELEQTGSPQGGIDFGTLSIFGSSKRSKEHLSLFEITCVYQSGDKTLTILTPSRSLSLQPLQIRFNGDLEMEEWQSELVNGMNSVRGASGPPSSPGSLFSVTSRGEVLVFDPKVTSAEDSDPSGSSGKKMDGQFSQDIPVKDQPMPLIRNLQNGFGPGSLLSLTLRIGEDAERFSINLQLGRPSVEADIALHMNPRMDSNLTVLNSRRSGEWEGEEKQPLSIIQEDGHAFKAFNRGQSVQVVIKAETNYYQVIVNGTPYCRFKHRVKPEEITHFRLNGDIEAKSVVYHSKSVIIPPSQMYWRTLGGGHFLKVETCAVGVTWGLGYDCKPWVYTGGFGGAHFKPCAGSKLGIGPVDDTKFFYIYENQRWNPLTGFTSHGLPTDRHSWSDRTGKYAMSKETIKPPSVHWQWVSDWLIDFTTPGGVDKEGWQYATDFPSSYHSKPRFTDYVRRRRWARKCKVQTSGPWRQLGATKLLDVSMMARTGSDIVDLWAVVADGDVLYRDNVRINCPEGTNWLQVPSDTPMQSISVGKDGNVWAVGRDGSAFLRHGVNEASPMGQFWLQVHRPQTFGTDAKNGVKTISVGGVHLVWALDGCGRLFLRQEVTKVFPEGTNWLHVANDIKSISASNNELWAVLESASSSTVVGGLVTALVGVNTSAVMSLKGVLARRSGVTPNNPMGTGWDIAAGGGWKSVSVRGRHRQQ